MRILVAALTRKDALLTSAFLKDAGIASVICDSLDAVCLEMKNGAGALLLAEETLTSDEVQSLNAVLQQQPPWSDLPIIVTRRAGEDSPETTLALTLPGNVILLERPMRVTTMVSTVRTALRSRERQYQARDYLAEREQRAQEIHALNTQLEVRVFERTKELEESNKVLMQRTEELVRVNVELERFAYISSHDLQEPLRTVSSYVKLLAKRYKGRLDQDADDFIGYAVDATERMRNLIRDLLKYSLAGARHMRSEPADCNAVVAEVLATMKTGIEDSGAAVTTGFLPIVKGDSSQLALVFQNLVANALKFRRKETPRIHITAQQQGAEWLFSISDNGIGIEPEYLARIFEIYKRLHTQEEYPGTGIGLAICKRIIEAHNGHIWAESVLGKGSTFYFTLPALSHTSESDTQ